MTVDEVLKLIDAGFTKADIETMNSGKPVEPEPSTEPEPQPVKTELPDKSAPGPAEDPNAARYAELLQAMQQLTGAIQADNIRRSNNKDVPELSAEEIMAEVLTPKPKGGKK